MLLPGQGDVGNDLGEGLCYGSVQLVDSSINQWMIRFHQALFNALLCQLDLGSVSDKSWASIRDVDCGGSELTQYFLTNEASYVDTGMFYKCLYHILPGDIL